MGGTCHRDFTRARWAPNQGTPLTRARRVALIIAALALATPGEAQTPGAEEFEFYHPIKTDSSGHIIPWYDASLGKSFDHIIRLVFHWWVNIENDPRDPSGIPYYMLHQVWRPPPEFDERGLGGDQLAMALSSWGLLYQYTGDTAVRANMVLIADLLLRNRFTKAEEAWPYIPYPYNNTRYSGAYDGNMTGGGLGYIEPDKAGSLGHELVVLYKITGDRPYLRAALRIANVLAGKIIPGDGGVSPLPYRVRARDGAVSAGYTSNWVGTLLLFEELQAMRVGTVAAYRQAHTQLVSWLKGYPLRTNRWGPFFEDQSSASNTQINAATVAMYIMDHRASWGSTWQADARSALDWCWTRLGNDQWKEYGVRVMNEQTAYPVPGSSHSSRQAAAELRYAELTGDTSRVENAKRMLSWATYHVDTDGKNRYYHDDIWLTDGYGDFVRHFLRAMAAAPELAPGDQDHLLRSSSVVQAVNYTADRIGYRTYDVRGEELLRVVTFTPGKVTAGGIPLPTFRSRGDLERASDGFTYGAAGDLPTVIRIRHSRSNEVTVVAH
jgi:hypothetical protein